MLAPKFLMNVSAYAYDGSSRRICLSDLESFRGLNFPLLPRHVKWYILNDEQG
jgi:hypothetical protein